MRSHHEAHEGDEGRTFISRSPNFVFLRELRVNQACDLFGETRGKTSFAIHSSAPEFR